MKGLKIFLLSATPLLLVLGILFKIFNAKSYITFLNWSDGGITINFTGNRLLAAALVCAVPLIVILKNEKDSR